MTLPLIAKYRDTPFNAGTAISRLDVFTATGSEDTYSLIHKTGLEVGSGVQLDSVLKGRHNGGFIVDGDDIILDITPTPGQAVIVPGSNSLDFDVSDQDDAIGRVRQKAFYLADVSTIQLFSYKASPAEPGIKLFLYDHFPAGGADPSWFRFAPALPDGSVGTFEAYGDPLYTADLLGQSNLSVAASPLDPIITVDDGSQFIEGDFLMIDQGLPTQETLKISTISGDDLTVPGLVGDSHSIGASVLACGRKFYLESLIPLDVAGGNVFNFYNLGLRHIIRATSRP